jgi:hypothetical protein
MSTSSSPSSTGTCAFTWDQTNMVWKLVSQSCAAGYGPPTADQVYNQYGEGQEGWTVYPNCVKIRK